MKKPVTFPSQRAGNGAVLYGFSNDAVAGRVEFSKTKSGKVPALRYSFEPPLAVPQGYSLELSYRFVPAEAFVRAPPLAMEIGGDSWTLPASGAFLGLEEEAAALSYATPLPAGPLTGFSLSFPAGPSGSAPEAGFPPASFFEIQSLALVPRWYGFVSMGSKKLALTPYVFSNAADSNVYTITLEAPVQYRPDGAVELTVAPLGSGISVEGGGAEIECRFAGGEGSLEAPKELRIPPALLSYFYWPLRISTDLFPDALELAVPVNRSFPLEPIPADPGLVLDYPQEAWRDSRYEVFRWPSFPSLLLFDTAGYQVQERLFKRLAFFTEKKDYRGRLLTDEQMKGIHGWNAHDYGAEDLARFFELARTTGFPLTNEERELQAVLLAAGILAESGPALIAGEGAVISISQESSPALRSRFMVHEGFHGIFFIDEDFRAFSRRRWENLNPQAKRFLLSYLDYSRYDTKDTFLVVNEFMAYCLQQSVPQAAGYFGETLPAIIEAHPWRYTVLPPKDEETGSWPLLARVFAAEAEAFSAYVNRRWGLAAGRVHSAVLRADLRRDG